MTFSTIIMILLGVLSVFLGLISLFFYDKYKSEKADKEECKESLSKTQKQVVEERAKSEVSNQKLLELTSRIKSFDDALEQIKISNASQTEKINNVSGSISRIDNVFNSNQQRGQLGENLMYISMEKILGSPGGTWAKQYTLSNGTVADSVIFLDMLPLVIDSKFPFSAYENNDTSSLIKDMKKHINDISSKYLIKDETHEMAFMYIPSDSIVDTISKNSTIIDYAIQNKVFIISPSLLYPTLALYKGIIDKLEKYSELDNTLLKIKVFDNNWDKIDEKNAAAIVYIKKALDLVEKQEFNIRQAKKITSME